MTDETVKKRKAGAKLKLTPEVSQRICLAIQNGLSIKKACKAAGIVEHTYFNWLDEARTGKEPYLQFLKDVEAAQIQFEQTLLSTILQSAMQGNTADSRWLLAVKYPDEYGPRKPSEAESSEEQGRVVIEILDDVEPDREIAAPNTVKKSKKKEDEITVLID